MRWHRTACAFGVIGSLLGTGCGDDSKQPEVPSVAFLRAVAGAPSTEPTLIEELRQNGFVPGVSIRLIDEDPDIAYPNPEDAAAAVARWRAEGVDLILALSSSGAAVARDHAPDVNVLFISNDPTATGLVADESSPRERLTGVTFRVPADRTVDLARQVIPDLRTLGLAYPADDPAAAANREALQRGAREQGVELAVAPFADERGLATAVERVVSDGAQALVLSTSPAATRLLDQTAQQAARLRIPVIANTSLADFAVVSLAPDNQELGRQLGRQAARLLSGSPPSAVPVEDPRRFVLVLNARAAEELDLVLSEDLLRQAAVVHR